MNTLKKIAEETQPVMGPDPRASSITPQPNQPVPGKESETDAAKSTSGKDKVLEKRQESQDSEALKAQKTQGLEPKG
jgi:hypothetical protein